MSLINISGGVALAMFGVRFLRKGLDRLFGHNLIAWLERTTSNRMKAFMAGIGSGVVAPSSTAQSLMALQLLSTGKLDPAGMLAIVLGSNLGITLMIQLLAGGIHDFAILFILAGVIAFQFLKSNLARGLGQVTLSLGFIFLGMQFIGAGAADFGPEGDLAQILKVGERHAWLVVTLAGIMTMLLQSSTAAIGLGLGFAASGLLTLPLLIPWILGVNFGTGMTTLIAGWTRLEGRRLGVANLLSKAFLAVPILVALPWVMKWLAATPGDLPRQMVNLHTAFNLAAGLVTLPFIGPLTKLTAKLLPGPRADSKNALDERVEYLDEKALESPSLALAHATREVLRMADEIMRMLATVWAAHVRREAGLAVAAQAHDDRVDEAYMALKQYLSRISEQDLSAKDSHWQFTLLSFSNELEAVGDIISKNLYELITREVSEGHHLTARDSEAVTDLYLKVIERLEIAISLVTSRDPDLAKAFLAGKEPFNEWCRGLQKAHYDRLKATRGEEALSSAYFLELLNFLRRINSHISTIGYAFLTEE